ncbi:MAG: bifunctional methionine sulfoxide reductase B/A protein [Bacteroidales bacterium]|nr:bifunctional methionine sulfoxide reductase B/A protein [Bacteroidales bacterium]
MKNIFFLTLIVFTFGLNACSQNNNNNNINLNNDTMQYNDLTIQEQQVLLNKGTEMSFTGKYYTFNGDGTYLCKQCNAPLYKSSDKFDAHCGWPSFDDEISGAITKSTDADGQRTEITCSNCGAHLGHVFMNEGFTAKNTRHCVNSISLNFVPIKLNVQQNLQRAVFAAGCFWGVEYYLQKQAGVVSTTVGYIGGNTTNPTYQDVCSHTTGHVEAVEVYFDPTIVSYEKLTKLFFEIHDPTQIDRQGPDVGDQYRSEIFYMNDYQKNIAQDLINQLTNNGYNVATKLTPATEFYPAEDYHQDYYQHKGSLPYCHVRTTRF